MDVQWRETCQSLGERYGHMLESQQWTDVTFQVDSKTFKAHKVILAGGSPVFETQFFGPMAEANPIISVEDVDPEAFQTLLSYIYRDTADIPSVEAAFHIYRAADKYLMPKLKSQCMKYITTHLSPSNLCKTYEFSKLYSDQLLMKKCLRYFAHKTIEVLSKDEFYEAELSTVVELFESPCLAIPSEIVLLVAAERYYSSRQHSVALKCSPPALCMYNVLEKIRFLTMTPQEFVNNMGGCSLLSEGEQLSLLKVLTLPECGAPLPQGLSTCKEKRQRPFAHAKLSGRHFYVVLENEEQKLNGVLEAHKLYDKCLILCSTYDGVMRVKNRITAQTTSGMFSSTAQTTSGMFSSQQHNGFGSSFNVAVSIVYDALDPSTIDTVIQQHYTTGGCLIATASLAAKVDMAKVTRLVNFDPPEKASQYQACAGVTITLVTPHQETLIPHIEDCHMVEMRKSDSVAVQPTRGIFHFALQNTSRS